MNGIAMWVWLSMRPGRRKHPDASMTSALGMPTAPTAAISSPSMSTSATDAWEADTTVPPRTSVLMLHLR